MLEDLFQCNYRKLRKVIYHPPWRRFIFRKPNLDILESESLEVNQFKDRMKLLRESQDLCKASPRAKVIKIIRLSLKSVSSSSLNLIKHSL